MKIRERLTRDVRNVLGWYNRTRLRNRDFTLITNTCMGGIIFHELKLRFCSPTINCGIRDHDEYLLFCAHLEHYLSLDIDFVQSKWKYPVGILHGDPGDVWVYFTHYHSVEEARSKWMERRARVRYDNLVVMMDGDNCLDYHVEAFDRLPMDRKVILTMKEFPQCKSVFAIKRKDYPQGDILEYGLLHGGARWYELFDFVHFFNTGEIRNNALFRNR
ncbi:MAG: DUF1919 domain-containing protein [Bacteroidales bacterium]|nr:DUF1919 domain-containing protein [Bacteroidales bacterium]